MNVYDFDGTIYDGDSTLDFYYYCVHNEPRILYRLPIQTLAFFRYKLGFIGKTEFKEAFYIFIKDINSVENTVLNFWNRNDVKIKDWYMSQRKKDDLVISASPEFLLEEICARIGIKFLIASQVDKRSGKYTGVNCYGTEKVRRFRESFPDVIIESFYSDSRSDTPMAMIAKKAFMVKGNVVRKWYNED